MLRFPRRHKRQMTAAILVLSQYPVHHRVHQYWPAAADSHGMTNSGNRGTKLFLFVPQRPAADLGG